MLKNQLPLLIKWRSVDIKICCKIRKKSCIKNRGLETYLKSIISEDYWKLSICKENKRIR